MNEPKWEFAPTGGGVEDGFSDAFIEAFTGDVDRSLAREIIQNGLDARLDDTKPVTIEFQRIEINNSEVPGKDQIQTIFEKCLDYYKDDKKVKKFFSKAIELITVEKVNILKISDFNTIGLRGEDDDKNGEWYCLVKAQGASSKQEEKLGSFGIGKGAPFAASAFHMVFYSTINDKNENVFQGQARLVSHLDDEVKRGSGSFGLKNQRSIRDKDLIPELFKRKERGTDINVIGYLGKENEWKEILIKSVLENFWAAILNKDLEIIIGNNKINFDTLEDTLIKYCGYNDPNSPYYYYSTFNKPTKYFETALKTIGTCKLYILLQEKAPKKIALMRNRMLVKEKPFRSPKPYIGVFICEDKQGNNILRDMEPPTHNDWEPKRIEKGTIVIKEIENWIRECLRELNTSEETDTSAIPGLEKYFQLPEDQDYEGDIENYFAGVYSGKETDTETSKEIDKKNKSKPSVGVRHTEQVINTTIISGGGDQKRKRQGKLRVTAGNGVGGGDKPGGLKSISEIACGKRCFLLKKLTDECEYCIILNPEEDFEGNIKISGAGEDSEYNMELLEAKDAETNEPYSIKSPYILDVVLSRNNRKKIYARIKSKNKNSLILG